MIALIAANQRRASSVNLRDQTTSQLVYDCSPVPAHKKSRGPENTGLEDTVSGLRVETVVWSQVKVGQLIPVIWYGANKALMTIWMKCQEDAETPDQARYQELKQAFPTVTLHRW